MSPRKDPMTEELDRLADLVIMEFNRGEGGRDAILSDARRAGILTKRQLRYVRLRAFNLTHRP